MPSLAAARALQDIIAPHPDNPHTTQYVTGSPTVFINGKPAVRRTDKTLCTDTAIGCSSTVFANGLGLHRVSDMTTGHPSSGSYPSGAPTFCATGSDDVFSS